MTQLTAQLIVLITMMTGLLAWLAIMCQYRRMRTEEALIIKDSRTRFRSTEEATGVLISLLSGQEAFQVSCESNDTVVVKIYFALLRARMSTTTTDVSLRFETDFTAFNRLRNITMLVFLLALIPLVLFGLSGLSWFFFVPSTMPGGRWQVLHMIHVVHVLWPPFLIYYANKRFRALIISLTDNLAIALR